MVVRLRSFKSCRKTGLKFVAIRGAVRLVAPPNRIMACDRNRNPNNPTQTRNSVDRVLLTRRFGLARYDCLTGGLGLRNETLMETQSLALAIGLTGQTLPRLVPPTAYYGRKCTWRWGAVDHFGDCLLHLGLHAIGFFR